jgi:hypothetical protein
MNATAQAFKLNRPTRGLDFHGYSSVHSLHISCGQSRTEVLALDDYFPEFSDLHATFNFSKNLQLSGPRHQESGCILGYDSRTAIGKTLIA